MKVDEVPTIEKQLSDFEYFREFSKTALSFDNKTEKFVVNPSSYQNLYDKLKKGDLNTLLNNTAKRNAEVFEPIDDETPSSPDADVTDLSYRLQYFNACEEYTDLNSFNIKIGNIISGVERSVHLTLMQKETLVFEMNLLKKYAYDLENDADYWYSHYESLMFSSNTSGLGISTTNRAAKGNLHCKLNTRGILIGAVVAGFIGAAAGAKAGAVGGTFVIPFAGTVSGGVAGLITGFAGGFISGAATTAVTQLMETCFRSKS